MDRDREIEMESNRDKIIKGVRLILEGIGEDSSRAGLVDTPERVADFWNELTAGYTEDAADILSILPGESHHKDVVIVRSIEFSSVCEHHLAPFLGKCDIAYLPGDEGIIGISKLGRLVDIFSRRLQVQERLTSEIADALSSFGKAKGVIVKIVASHTCMTMRGVKKIGAETVTISKRGIFATDHSSSSETLSLLNSDKH